MMYKEKNSGLRRLRGLVLALAPVAAIAVVSIPAVAGCLDGMRAASLESADEPAQTVSATTVHKDTQKSGESTTTAMPEKLAQYPGGEPAMYKYLAQNIKYPESAMKAGHQGRSVVQFIVQADGSLSNFEIVRSTYPELDGEAIRVIATMPKWIPAQLDGKAVSSTYTLPVTFKITGGEKAETKKADKTFDDVVVVGYGRKPDNSSTITIRNADLTGPNAPTVLVDGKKTTDVDNIDTETIESITVYKDKNKAEYPNGLIEIKLKH